MKKLFLGYPFKLKFIRETVERACAGIAEVHVASDRLRGAPLIIKIEQMIEEADLSLFDLTNHNANVALELGVAFARSKKWAILYCDDPRYAPNPGQESSVFSDLKGWDSIIYRDPDDLETNLRRLLPEFIAARHLGFNLASVRASALASHDPSLRPRLYVEVRPNYGMAVGTSSSPVRKISADTTLVSLRNGGQGAANNIRVAITGFSYVDQIQTLAPGEKTSHLWPLEDQQAYRVMPQFPAITVEFEDDMGSRYRQIGKLNTDHRDGVYYYFGKGLGPPELIDDFSVRGPA